MSDRTPVKLALVLALIALAIYTNVTLFAKDYRYPSRILGLLGWQGTEDVRSLALREGLDLQGGLQVLLQVDPNQGAFTADDLALAARVIQNRVDSLGVTEAHVQIQGNDKIVVELPGVDDPELAERTIGSTAKLEFIYGGDPTDATQGPNIPQENDVVETTAPALWKELQPEFREPRLIDPEELATLRGAAEAGTLAPVATVTTTGTSTQTLTPGATTATGDADAAASPAADEGATGAVTTTAATTATEGLTTTEAAATGALTATGATTATGETTKTFASRVYPTVLTGASIENATVVMDNLNQPAVSFTLSGDGGSRLLDFTRDHIDQSMPIVLDGKVISSPLVRAAIGGQGQITGRFTEEEAESLAVQLRSGSLPVKLETVGRTTIGPTLGRESVHLAVLGGIIGLIGVIFFMIAYYRLPGVLASLALLTYVLFSLTIFRLIPVTLTLAGIAGFALSIGMAVDANILIFERMKEELRSGRRMRAATDIGFERAWPSIRDSNLSTLITCAILFWFGSQFGASIVKGFAVTLSVGVVTSMFTAIFVSRTFLEVTGRYLMGDLSSVIPAETPKLRTLFGF